MIEYILCLVVAGLITSIVKIMFMYNKVYELCRTNRACAISLQTAYSETDDLKEQIVKMSKEIKRLEKEKEYIDAYEEIGKDSFNGKTILKYKKWNEENRKKYIDNVMEGLRKGGVN